MERIALEKFQLSFRRYIDSDAWLNNSRIEAYRDAITGLFIADLRTWFLKSPHPATKIQLSAPKNAWEHFKEEVFPKWLLAWFPVKYGYATSYEYGPIYICPHFTEKWGDGPTVHLEWLQQRGGDYL